MNFKTGLPVAMVNKKNIIFIDREEFSDETTSSSSSSSDEEMINITEFINNLKSVANTLM